MIGRRTKKRIKQGVIHILSKKRIKGIDAMRAFAAFAIVLIHVFPIPTDSDIRIKILVQQTARFAVPFFFVTAGFFYAQRIQTGLLPIFALKKSFNRILPIFLFWSFIFFINPHVKRIHEQGLVAAYFGKFVELISNVEKLIFVGPGFHLWFFISLMYTVIVFHLLSGYKKNYLVIMLAFFLYVFGVMGGSYAKSAIGLAVPINTRNFIFFSMLPFTIGYYLYGTEGIWRNCYFGIFLWATGSILHFFEIFMLNRFDGISIRSIDYVFSTVLMGVGAFIVGRSNPPFFGWKPLVKLGLLSVGIYAIHPLFSGRLNLVENLCNGRKWMVIAPLSIFLISGCSAYLMSKISHLRKFVM